MNNFTYSCPYEPFCSRAPQFTHVRFLHAVPNAPSVDVYANNSIIANNVAYRRFTQYFPLLPGTYNIKIYPAGQKTNPILDKNINLQARNIMTLPIIGSLPGIELFEVLEKPIERIPGKTYIRFAHISGNTPTVDVVLPNGTKLFSSIAYKGVTDYIPIDPGSYTLLLKLVNSAKTILTVPNINLKPDKIYTVYAVGVSGGTPPLQVLIPLDGNTYIDPFQY